MNIQMWHRPAERYPVHITMFFLMIPTLANPNVIKMSCTQSQKDTKQKQSVVVSVDKDKTRMWVPGASIRDSLESVLMKHIHEGDSIKPAVVINADSVAQWARSCGWWKWHAGSEQPRLPPSRDPSSPNHPVLSKYILLDTGFKPCILNSSHTWAARFFMFQPKPFHSGPGVLSECCDLS